MDFVAVMVFTQQVFRLECYFDSFWYLRLLLFGIKSQPGVAYKNIFYKKACDVVVFFCIMSKKYKVLHQKSFVTSGGFGKKIKKGRDGHIEEVCL